MVSAVSCRRTPEVCVITRRMTKADYEELAEFRYALRQFQRASEQRAIKAGLTIQQYLALLAIKGFSGRDHVTVGELAERLLIHHHSAVGLVDRLVSNELVMRQPAIEDRRQVYVILTSRGAEVLETIACQNRAQLRDLRPVMNTLLETLANESAAISASPEL